MHCGKKNYMLRPDSLRYVALMGILLLFVPVNTAAAGGLRGYVFGLREDGRFEAPVAGAKIEFILPNGQVAATATTNASGYYQVNLSPGIYAYRITAPGYQTDDAGRQISVQHADRYVLRNFAVKKGPEQPARPPEPQAPAEPLATLRGHVYEQAGRSREGIPGASVILRQKGTRRVIRVVTAAGNRDAGAYSVIVPAGTYDAAAMADGYASVVVEGLELRPEETKTQDFLLRPLQRQTATLRVLTRLEPAPTAPVPGRAEVWIRRAGPDRRVIGPIDAPLNTPVEQSLPPGQYLLAGRAADGKYAGHAGPVELLPGETVDVELVLRGEVESRGATVLVRVLDQAQRPISNARVILRPEGAPLREATTATTGTDGSVRFTQLAPGSYQALAQKEGYRPAGQVVQLRAGEAKEVIVVLVQAQQVPPSRLAKVRGWVVYPDAKSRTGYFGVARARLAWTPIGSAGASRETTSGSDGSYEVDLEPGNYRVTVYPPDQRFSPLEESVSVPPGGLERKFFVLKPRTEPAPVLVTVRGFVRERLAIGFQPSRGPVLQPPAPVPGAVLRWVPAGNQGSAAVTTSDSLGNFVVTLPAGDYIVDVQPPRGFRPARHAVSVAPGIGPVVIELERVGGGVPLPPEERGTVLVQVVQQLGPFLPAFRPVPNARVLIYLGNRPVAQGATDASGRFETRLPDGTYNVVAAAGPVQGSAVLFVRNGRGEIQVVLRGQDVERPEERPVPPEESGVVPVTVTVLRPDEKARGGHAPVAGATVLFRSGGEIVTRGTTDEDGTYRTRLPAGRYLVVARHDQYGEAVANVVIGRTPYQRSIILGPPRTRPNSESPLLRTGPQ